MNFRNKLRILTLVTVAGLSLVAFFTISGLGKVNDAEETAHRRKAYVIDLLEIKASAISTIMLNPSLPETQDVFVSAEANINQHAEIINRTIKRKEVLQEFQGILSQWQSYDLHSREIISLAANDFAVANSKVIPLYNKEFKPFQARLEQFVADRQGDAEFAKSQAEQASDQVFWENIGLLIFVCAINIILELHITSALASGLKGIQQQLIPLKQGDLTKRLPVTSDDELSEIGRGVNDFIKELQQIVQKVRMEASNLATSASELAFTSKAVLQSSSQQSDATSAVAATVEEYSVSIDQVSSNAAEAEHLASQYGKLSLQGGNDVQTAIAEIRRIELAVNNAVQKMQVLGEQAHEISSIVKVIKDVADQTNLLALNAAIEAARAGDSGRGFSVVADEVRNLAKRTAKSAQEITNMISSIQAHTETAANVMEQGNECVISGVKQAELAGQSMQQINDSSLQVMHAISDISLALHEQRIAGNDIAKNIERISNMTEQNGVSVAGVSAAAIQLESLAADLRQAVEKFAV